MKPYLKALLPGVAGSILFWAVDNWLLKTGGTIRIGVVVLGFVLLSAASLLLFRKSDAAERRIASGRTIGGDSTDRIGEIRVKGDASTDVLSSNRVKGNSAIDVDRIDIG